MFWTKIIIPVEITLFEKEKRLVFLFFFAADCGNAWNHSEGFDDFDLANLVQSC